MTSAGAKRNARMVRLSRGDLTDLYTGWSKILAIMHFPGDDQREDRKSYEAELERRAVGKWERELAALHEDIRRAKREKIGLMSENVDCIERILEARIRAENECGFRKFGGFTGGTLIQSVSDITHGGETAGHLLKLILRCKRHHRDDGFDSMERVISAVEVKLRTAVGPKLAKSQRSIRNWRSDFDSVLHFWAAWNDRKQTITKRRSAGSPYPLKEFLARAEAYYALAQSCRIAAKGEPERPIISPDTAWRVRVESAVEPRLYPLRSHERIWFEEGIKEQRLHRARKKTKLRTNRT